VMCSVAGLCINELIAINEHIMVLFCGVQSN